MTFDDVVIDRLTAAGVAAVPPLTEDRLRMIEDRVMIATSVCQTDEQRRRPIVAPMLLTAAAVLVVALLAWGAVGSRGGLMVEFADGVVIELDGGATRAVEVGDDLADGSAIVVADELIVDGLRFGPGRYTVIGGELIPQAATESTSTTIATTTTTTTTAAAKATTPLAPIGPATSTSVSDRGRNAVPSPATASATSTSSTTQPQRSSGDRLAERSNEPVVSTTGAPTTSVRNRPRPTTTVRGGPTATRAVAPRVATPDATTTTSTTQITTTTTATTTTDTSTPGRRRRDGMRP